MSIQFAALTAQDYAEVRRLWEATPGVGLSSCDTEKHFGSYLQRNPGMSLVARDSGQIIAAIMCGHDSRRGYLTHLAVDPRYRGKGIGRRLVELCLQKLWTAGITGCNIRVYRDNADGIAFWERLGFCDVGVNVLRRELIEPDAAGGPDAVLLDELTDEDYLDPVPTVRVSDELVLTPFNWEDQPDLVRLLNETPWYSQQMPLIPHPYTAEHARSWVTKCMLQTYDGDRTRGWAIRKAGEFIGGIGIGDVEAKAAFEIGYWLARSHWGQGIMPAVVRSLTSFAFREYAIEKLFARVFHTNPASARVLEKAGYKLEGTLRRQILHQDVPRDVLYYGMLKEESS